MEVVVLSHAEVSELLSYDECIGLMAQALTDLTEGRIWHPLRSVVRPPDEPSLMGLMAAHRSEPTKAYAIKVVCIFPGNRARGLDSHFGTVTLYDGEVGKPLAVADAAAITAIRTAAGSAGGPPGPARAGARQPAPPRPGGPGRAPPPP